MLSYRGVGKDGLARSGALEGESVDVVAFVEQRFRSGWRRLIVHQDGELAGWIGQDAGRQHRLWWAEDDQALEVRDPAYCPGCGRVMSRREAVEQGACNDCSGGAWDPRGGDR